MKERKEGEYEFETTEIKGREKNTSWKEEL